MAIAELPKVLFLSFLLLLLLLFITGFDQRNFALATPSATSTSTQNATRQKESWMENATFQSVAAKLASPGPNAVD